MSLVGIRPGVQFRPDAAASFRRVEQHAGRQMDVNRTVVSYDEQMDLYRRRLRGEYPYPVAHPDYSNHVYRSDTDGGNAWDTDERGGWLDEHGWIADVRGEPWHREYRPDYDKHRNDPTPAGHPTTPEVPATEEEEEDMRFGHRNEGKDEWMIVHPSIAGGYMVTTIQAEAIAWSRLYGRGWLGDASDRYDFDVSRADYIALQKAAAAVAKAWQR